MPAVNPSQARPASLFAQPVKYCKLSARPTPNMTAVRLINVRATCGSQNTMAPAGDTATIAHIVMARKPSVPRALPVIECSVSTGWFKVSDKTNRTAPEYNTVRIATAKAGAMRSGSDTAASILTTPMRNPTKPTGSAASATNLNWSGLNLTTAAMESRLPTMKVRLARSNVCSKPISTPPMCQHFSLLC